MATLLNDKEIKSLFGSVLKDADEACIRPNSYVIRLGATGEFLNTGKDFDLSKEKKSIRIHAGHQVGLGRISSSSPSLDSLRIAGASVIIYAPGRRTVRAQQCRIAASVCCTLLAFTAHFCLPIIANTTAETIIRAIPIPAPWV